MSKPSFTFTSAERSSNASQSTTDLAPTTINTAPPPPPTLDISHPMIRALYYRAVDADDEQSIFRDRIAKDLGDRFREQFKIFEQNIPVSMRLLMITRTLLIDLQCVHFMDRHAGRGQPCTVLNLSGGLDTRVYRLEPKPHVRWYEVDRPEWTDVRRKYVEPHAPVMHNVRFVSRDVVNQPSGSHDAPAAAAHGKDAEDDDDDDGDDDDDDFPYDEDAWLRQMPRDHPTLIVMEATSSYFKRPRFDVLIRRLLEHFHRGELVLDVFGRAATFLAQNWVPWARRISTRIEWSCEDPASLERVHPKLRLEQVRSCVSMAEEEHDEWAASAAIGKLQLRIVKSGVLGGAVLSQLRVVRLTFS